MRTESDEQFLDHAALLAMQALLPMHYMAKMQVRMGMEMAPLGPNMEPSGLGTMSMHGSSDTDFRALAEEAYLCADALLQARRHREESRGTLAEILKEG